MKRKLLIFIVIGGVLCIWRQARCVEPPDSLWSRFFGGEIMEDCQSLEVTSDGGYILAGTTGGFTSSDALLVRTNANGDTLWSRTFGVPGEDFFEHFNSVCPTSDGGYIVAGDTCFPDTIATHSCHFWLVKTDENGQRLWSRSYGRPHYECCYSVQQTQDGGYILAGETGSYGAGSYDFWLLKTNENGDSLWSRTFGGSDNDYGRCVRQTSDGGYVLAGTTASFSAGLGDFWLLKTDANGDSLWSRHYGGIQHDECYAVQQTSDGGYILVGQTWSYGLDGDMWLVKTDANGDSLWNHTYGDYCQEICRDVRQTADGGYILAGTKGWGSPPYDNGWLVRTDANGNRLWSCSLGGTYGGDWFHAVRQTADGGYVIAGTAAVPGYMNTDMWLLKMAPERPYHLTIYLNEAGTNMVLRWMAPQACTYLVYGTTGLGADIVFEPPGPGWDLEAVLDLPAGSAVWMDPAPLGVYKRCGVIMSCP